MTGRATVFVLCVAGATAQAQFLTPRDLNQRGAAVERLHVWMESMARHRPGMLDEAARAVAAWTQADLDGLAIELQTLLTLIEAPRTSRFSTWIGQGRNEAYRQVVYTGSELDRLRRLALQAGGRHPLAPSTRDDESRIAAAQNRILKRGAAMHTAVAIGTPLQADSQRARGSRSGPAIVRFADGRQVGVDRSANHWRFARTLLDRVVPDPSTDDDVRLWYRASSAALLWETQLYPAHFEEAVRLFPDDAALLVLGGSLHEVLASDRVQAFARAAFVPGVRLDIGSPRDELRRAESLFRDAVQRAPDLPDARLHFGRVLSLQGRQADALEQLRRIDTTASPLMQYYASLFMGDASEAMGRPGDAREAYDRAAALYPRAQAPRLALSQLAAKEGNLAEASEALAAMWAADPEAQTDDPYWTYHVAAGRDADALLTGAYGALSEEPEP